MPLELNKINVISQLDTVLRVLNSGDQQAYSIGDIIKTLSEKHRITAKFSEVRPILNKLIKDEYAEITEEPAYVTERNRNHRYNVTFEGKTLLEMQEGYRGVHAVKYLQDARIRKLENEQREIQSNTLILTVILAIGTSIAAIYSLIQIFDYMIKFELFFLIKAILF